MLSENIPVTMATSSNDSTLSLVDFIEYSIINDLNIVTSKWLAHTRKITITESRNSLQKYWETTGKHKQFCATFSVLSLDEASGNYKLELVDSSGLESLPGKLISCEIYAIHAVPLRDRTVQLGMINVPIFDLAGEIEAPWINSPDFTFYDDIKSIDFDDKIVVQVDDSNKLDPTNVGPSAAKKMKMVKTTRTFMENGYQMTEVVNELVPCNDNDKDEDVKMSNDTNVPVPSKATETSNVSAPAVNKPPKQSSMMNFFKKK